MLVTLYEQRLPLMTLRKTKNEHLQTFSLPQGFGCLICGCDDITYNPIDEHCLNWGIMGSRT